MSKMQQRPTWMGSLLLPLLLLAGAHAHAAEPQDWEKRQLKARDACIKATEYKNAKVKGNGTDFNHHILLTIEGNSPFANGRKASIQCLYSVNENRADISDTAVAY